MSKILLHVCCGPCSLMPVVHLQEEGWEVTAFFFNPNIHPEEEWTKRCDAMADAAHYLHIPLIIEGAGVAPAEWISALHGKISYGERCRFCYRPRMERVAALAGEKEFDAFTSSLLYSRYQQHESIREEGERASAIYGTAFLYRDFRPWWWEGIAMAKEIGLYRQKWCGCILSMKEAQIQQKKALEEKAAQKAERAERLAKEKEERLRRKAAIAERPNKRARKAMARVAAEKETFFPKAKEKP